MTTRAMHSGFVWRCVSTFFGAFALLGQIKDFNLVSWQENFAAWIDSFRALTHPVVTYLFGWIASYFGWSFPAWIKDYLIVGFVTAGASFRMIVAYGKWSTLRSLKFIIESVAAWPLVVSFIVSKYFIEDPATEDEETRKLFRDFVSVFGLFLALIALNYALLLAGGMKSSG